MNMSQIDLFSTLIGTTDVKKKISIGSDVISYLQDPSNGIECEDIGCFIEGIIQWLMSSNFKVSLNGLEILGLLVDRMKDDFRPFLQGAITPCVDRLGDTKDSVREKANTLILKCMDKCAPPQQIFERLLPGFGHKSAKVREEVLLLLQTTLNTHSAASLSLSRLVPSIVKLLSDPSAPVRDVAFATLVEVYRHVGDRFKQDLVNKQNVPPSKLPALLSKFDELVQNQQMLPTAMRIDGAKQEDETDRGLSKSAVKRSTSAPPVRRNGQIPTAKPVSGPSTTSQQCATPVASSGSIGAMDESLFIQLFEDVPRIQIFSSKEMEEHMNSIREILSNTNNEWDKRVAALKKFRAILIAGAVNYDEFYQNLRFMEPPLLISVKDLRSLVVREACITIAFLSQQLGHKLNRFSETVLPALIGLIPNSAKVVSTSGIVAIRFIIANTHAPRLIPILTDKMTNKSKEIRKHVCEFLDQLVHAWPTQKMEKYSQQLQEAIRKGIADADLDARASARRAYYGFADHFKDQAAALLNSLDPHNKKALYCDPTQPMSNSSSHSSLNNVGRTPVVKKPSSTSTESLQKIPIPRRPAVPVGLPNGTPSLSARSNSAIELQAVQRSKLRSQQYAAAQRMKIGSGASLREAALFKAEKPFFDLSERGFIINKKIESGNPASRK
ncbi:hypothetical protein QYM36_000035 [Artemia franciscana]|uniref:TOG domain-containing protein n=1 Tax=Artemia franciscana TaxID=6661 RepID=A0AA88LG14_ARTSF|nr:hypothetical protein QYM36_000035 [Artemia franciscana]